MCPPERKQGSVLTGGRTESSKVGSSVCLSCWIHGKRSCRQSWRVSTLQMSVKLWGLEGGQRGLLLSSEVLSPCCEGLCENRDTLVCPAVILFCVAIALTGAGLHVVPLTFHSHVHAHATHGTRWSDSHVLLAVHDEAPHRLAIWIVGSSLTYCTV